MKLLSKFYNLILEQHAKTDMIACCKGRITFLIIFFFMFSCLMTFRLYDLTIQKSNDNILKTLSKNSKNITRAEILDRHGNLLATNLHTVSLYVRPYLLDNPLSTAKKLKQIFPDLELKKLEKNLSSNKKFVWIKRNLTPQQKQKILNLGIWGLFFEDSEKRIYTYKNLFSHILGFVGLDGKAFAGLELAFNDRLMGNTINSYDQKGNLKPLVTSLDLTVQDIVYNELKNAMDEFKSKKATAIVANAKTGEILSLVNLPDFDPNSPGDYPKENMFNYATMAVQELGSVLKPITMAAAVDKNIVKYNDVFDVAEPIKYAGYSLKDYRSKGGKLSTPEVLMYSSNIAMAKIATSIGGTTEKEYLEKFGFLDPINTEIKEIGKPTYPKGENWGNLTLMTVSYGHGIAVTPLHMVKAMIPLVNDGNIMDPTFLKIAKDTKRQTKKILKKSTVEKMQKMLRLTVLNGFGKKAAVKGYGVLGKSGTGEKAIAGGYSKTKQLSSFIGAFPISDPEYIVYVLLDEPKGSIKTQYFATGGWTAAPVAGKIIEKIGPVLGVQPVNEELEDMAKDIFNDFIPERPIKVAY